MRQSRPTISFVLLVAFAALASYGALLLAGQLKDQTESSYVVHKPEQAAATSSTASAVSDVSDDITTWKSFTDNNYFLSFKYPPQWQVATYPNTNGYYIVAIQPNTSADHIRIYVSPDHYFAMANLPTKKDTVAGATALNVNNMLYGVKYAAQYYTFDMGNSLSLQPQFKQIIASVAFTK